MTDSSPVRDPLSPQPRSRREVALGSDEAQRGTFREVLSAIRSATPLPSTPEIWNNPRVCRKNTFIDIAAPMSESIEGFLAMRQQISDPSPATQRCGDDQQDRAKHQMQRLTSCFFGSEVKQAHRRMKADPFSFLANADTDTTLPDEGCATTPSPSWTASPYEAEDAVATDGVAPLPLLCALPLAVAWSSSSSAVAAATAALGLATAASAAAMEAPPPARRKDFAKRLNDLGLPVETLMLDVPRDEVGEPLSLGSARHASSTCWPCTFVATEVGCKRGILCKFCHASHDDTKKITLRHCQGRRERYRKVVKQFIDKIQADPSAFLQGELKLPPSIEHDPTLKASFHSKLSSLIPANHPTNSSHDPRCLVQRYTTSLVSRR
mmetsp:Transcript_5926/g.22569  ORF Transcript_5926/g.22569 Transcript_5926/m.22569 type:complete len:380 (+) Transcript_5926:63-1202(+)